MKIAAEIMDRTGLSRHREEGKGVRWVAVRNTTARTTSTSPRRWPARTAAGPGWTTTSTGLARPCGISRRNTACRWWPGPTGRPRTGRPGPEREKADRAGRAEPARVTLQRQVAATAAGARSEPEFFAAPGRRGLLVRLRHSTHNPGEVTGYAVGLPGDTAATGGQIWYGGGKLAADLSLPVSTRSSWPHPMRPNWLLLASSTLIWPHPPGPEPLATSPAEPPSSLPRTEPGGARTSSPTILVGPEELGRVGPRQVRGISLPKLRARWPAVVPGTGPGPGPGRGRPDAARSALRHQIARCAAASRSEAGFFTGLRAARLLVRTRPGPDPDRPAGYAVTLPGLTGHRDGTPAWYGGGTLDPALALGVLRRRWQAGQPGLPPAAALLDHAAATAICQHAAAVADDAARRLRDAPPGQAADIARAAADILYAAADATGNRDLRAAADGFGRAARAPWGPVPAPTPPGNVLRTAAYLITATAPGPTRRLTRHALTRALAGLAAELARLRHAQQRPRQADAARTAAAALTAASHTPALDPDGLAPAIPQATAQAQPAARRRPTAGPPKRGRSR